MNPVTVARLRRRLAAQARLLDRDCVRDPIRVWRLSGVERWRLPNRSSVVFKYALPPFTGLPAEHWALGWHRVQAATWLLAYATSGVDKPATDPRRLVVLRRQLTSARELLAA